MAGASFEAPGKPAYSSSIHPAPEGPARAPHALWHDLRMLEEPVPRLRPLARVIVASWLVFAGLVSLGLAGELWLRIEWDQAWKASERLRTGNVFFTNMTALNAGDRALWHKPWRKY